jgi:hypothetical protein
MKAGSKVICIDASINPKIAAEIKTDFQQWITKDAIYTIREILTNDGLVTSVLLEEIHNKPLFFAKTIGRMQEPSFKIDRFRELDTAEFYEETKKQQQETLTTSI